MDDTALNMHRALSASRLSDEEWHRGASCPTVVSGRSWNLLHLGSQRGSSLRNGIRDAAAVHNNGLVRCEPVGLLDLN